MKKIIALFSSILIVLDQLIKYVIANNLELNETKEIIHNFFSITYVQNFGAAWSMFNGYVFILVIVSFLALFFIYMLFIHNKNLNKMECITYSLLMGGIIGNLIDRVFLGYVIDYLSFNIFGYMFPVFNLADICIVLSVIFLIIMCVLEEITCKKLK